MMEIHPSVGSHENNNQQAHHTQQAQKVQHTICIPTCDGATNAAMSSFNIVFPYVVRFLVMLVTFGCSIVAAIVMLPLLLACFLVTRFLQFIFALGHEYDKSVTLKVVIKLKLVLRTWIYIDSAYLMCLLLVLYGVAQLVPHLGLKYVKVLGCSMTYWIETYFIVFGICSMNYIVSIFVIRFVIFNIPLKYHTFQSSSHVVSDTVHETIDCFILFLLTEQEVIIRTPILKQYRILGFYPIHRLLHVLILLLVFHNLIRSSIHIIVWQLHKLVTDPKNHPNSFHHLIATKFWGRESIVYWANGMKPSIMLTFTSLMLLLTWVFYFGSQLDANHRPTRAKKVFDFGTWTFLCLFIFSFLWLIKTCVLLLLEIRTVYCRFGPKISKGGKQLYLLGIIGRHNNDIFKLRYNAKRTSSSQTSMWGYCPHKMKKAFKVEITRQDISDFFTTKQGVSLIMLSLFPVLLIKDEVRYQNPTTDPDENNWEKPIPGKSDEYYGKKVKRLSAARKEQVRDDLFMQEKNSAMIYELQKMVHYFLEAKESLSQDNYTSDILQTLKGQADAIDSGSIVETLKRLTDGENEHKIDGESEQSSRASKEVKHDDDDDLHSFRKIRNFEDLRIWMERARNHCLFLANTLRSAKELVECLDKFMSVLIIVVIFILWLLLTELATTKVFVLIGSPILAFNFIFGDATKTFFQGIVFVYLVNPFDVGDLCVIDGNMVEVITIGVWKTTFSKVDTREEVIYPNSDLVNKDIINHRTEFDWNDYVELYVNSADTNDLIQKIEKSLKDEKYESIPGCVEVMTIADNNIKIGVSFRYNTDLQKKNMSYFEYFWEKRKLRSEFVRNLVVDEKQKGGPNIQIVCDDQQEEGIQ